MRMYGRLALHAESVVLPLLAPDAPVVTWWYGEPPHLIAHDPLGVFADRRVTDSVARRRTPLAALRAAGGGLRAGRHRPGLDPDDAVAGAVRRPRSTPSSGPPTRGPRRRRGRATPSRALLAGWLQQPARARGRRSRTSAGPRDHRGRDAARRRTSLRWSRGDGRTVVAVAAPASPTARCRCPSASSATCSPRSCAGSTPTRPTPRRWGRSTGTGGLSDRPATRSHVWVDPALEPPRARWSRALPRAQEAS